MSDGYRYAGLEASLYDALDELSDFEDLDFYVWFAGASTGPILDVGCGTGRILLPLVEKGWQVVGLDNSPEMLEQCRRKLADQGLEAELVQAEMRDFELGEQRFGSIFVPGFSVQLLLDDADFEGFLACCRRCLKPDGQLLISTHLPWEMIWDGRRECPLEERRSVSSQDGQERLVAWQGWELDTVAQRLKLRNRIERLDVTGSILASEDKEMTLRWFLPHEMLQRLGEAGFGDVSMYGDFSLEAPEADSDSVSYLARISP